jgi:tRNA(fMet)-specific endonuclease VapC
MPTSPGYLLDTNILVRLIQGNDLGKYIDQRFALTTSLSTCVISVVTVGEMKALVHQFQWGQQKRTALDNLLGKIPWIDINDAAILDAYGNIDGHNKQLKPHKTMGKNDVWIAATAHVTKLTLLTIDHDFDHLEGLFLTRIWIDPASKPQP